MGRVRKGRKSSNLFFEILGNRVMLNSVQNHSSIPQLSIITELSMPRTFFCICSFLTAKNSQDFKKQQKPEGCDSLLPVGNLRFSFFFCQNHTPSIIFEGKTSKCEVSNIFGCCGFSAFKCLSRHISSTHGKSQGKSVWGLSLFCWPVIPELIGSRFSHAKDLRFFSLLQKSPMDLRKGLYTVSSANYLLGFAL